MPVHLIFEGAELSGKSFLMSQVYPVLEKRYSRSAKILDGCAWFNSDNGVMGSPQANAVVEKYVEIAEVLQNRAIMFEKLHLSDIVYSVLANKPQPDYSKIEKKLSLLNFKIVFTTFLKDPDVIKHRLQERLNLYPHYQKIAKEPEFYFHQQDIYRSTLARSILPSLEITLSDFSDSEIKPLLDWIDK